MKKRSKFYLSGILYMVQASIAFSVMALCVKTVSRWLPSLEIVFFRSLFGTLLILTVMIAKKVPLLGQQRRLMFFRGLSGFAALSLFFYTISKIPLGTAVLLNYTSPIFAAILATAFLGERPSRLLTGMILTAFLGVYFLVEGQFPDWNIYVLFGLLSAFFASIAYVLIRAVKHRESPLTIIFYFTGISTLGSLFYLPFGFVWPNPKAWLALIGVAIGSFFGQLWLTISLRRAPASLLGPFSYVTPLLTFLYGIVFFGEIPTVFSAFGAFLIILGGSLISLSETKKHTASAKKRKEEF
ncbi:MAG: DMT family transporter [Candidatus Omnitrophica bacterium]|nr:DMT family transporter [Candidatus Omnitrophota bacterium]